MSPEVMFSIKLCHVMRLSLSSYLFIMKHHYIQCTNILPIHIKFMQLRIYWVHGLGPDK